MQILFKFQVNWMKIDNFKNTTLVVDLGPMLTFWPMSTSKIIGWLNSVTWNINPLQLSSRWDENWGFYKYHHSCWPLAYVDLLVHVDLKNNFLVEFSDLISRSCSNFKSIRWKVRILETLPSMLPFGLCWPQIIGGWINWTDMQILFKFLVNRMKIDNFRNAADVDSVAHVDLKNNWWLNLMIKYATPLQISSQSDENGQFLKLGLRWPFGQCWPQNNWWLNTVTWNANPL